MADELAFIRAPLPEEELISATINGLGSEYNLIVVVVSATRFHGTFTFSDLWGLLLSHEALLKIQIVTNSSAFYAGSDRGGNNNRYRQQHPPPFQTRSTNNLHRPNNSFGPSLPASGLLGSAPEHKPICQICTRVSHSAKLCFRRYDPDQDWKPPNNRFKAYTSQPVSSTQTSNEWIIDFGVSNHVTNDINNLSSFFSYNGSEKLQIGNSNGLLISHIGNTSFTLPNLSIQLNMFYMYQVFLQI
jgi:hypothetical protein